MTEIEQLRHDTKNALGFLAHAIGATAGAGAMLMNMESNWREAAQKHGTTEGLDLLLGAMLLQLSSLALKQEPDNATIQEMYRGLRGGRRH